MTHWPKKPPGRAELQFVQVPALPKTDDKEASALVKAGWSPGSQSNLTFNAWESRRIARCRAAYEANCCSGVGFVSVTRGALLVRAERTPVEPDLASTSEGMSR